MKLYHMAPKGSLKEGQIIESIAIKDLACNDEYTTQILKEYFADSFSKGVCAHGEAYFASCKYTYISPIVELLFEKGRKGIDNNLPSRANCIFAIDDLKSFQKLSELMKVNIQDYDIYEVKAKRAFKADMYLIDTVQFMINQSVTIASMLIDYYWKGYPLKRFLKNEDCFWEYLLEPPVEVIKKIDVERR